MMGVSVDDLVCRCLAEHREKKIQALVNALQTIVDEAPDKEPKPQPGADSDVLLAYEDGYADAAWFIAGKARDALDDWQAA